MCLSTVSERIEKPSRKVVKAWKVFDSDDNENLRSPFQRFEAKRDTWVSARRDHLKTGGYESGFHAFQTEVAARRWADIVGANLVLPVKLRYVRTIGEQDGARVLVADEMLIPRKGK